MNTPNDELNAMAETLAFNFFTCAFRLLGWKPIDVDEGDIVHAFNEFRSLMDEGQSVDEWLKYGSWVGPLNPKTYEDDLRGRYLLRRAQFLMSRPNPLN